MMDIYLRRLSLIGSRYASLYLRIALAAAFLTSVTDRFGLWGPSGTMNVALGDMTHFMAYTGKLNPWFPSGVIPVVAGLSLSPKLSWRWLCSWAFIRGCLHSSADGYFWGLGLG